MPKQSLRTSCTFNTCRYTEINSIIFYSRKQDIARGMLQNQTPVWTLVSGFEMIVYKAFYILVNPAGSGQPLKSLRATWISADWRTRRREYRDQQHEKSSKEHPQTFPSTKQYKISSMKIASPVWQESLISTDVFISTCSTVQWVLKQKTRLMTEEFGKIGVLHALYAICISREV